MELGRARQPDSVLERLVAWLGESRRPQLTEFVDARMARRGPIGAWECEQDLIWAVHTLKRCNQATSEEWLWAADVLAGVNLDAVIVEGLDCREHH